MKLSLLLTLIAHGAAYDYNTNAASSTVAPPTPAKKPGYNIEILYPNLTNAEKDYYKNAAKKSGYDSEIPDKFSSLAFNFSNFSLDKFSDECEPKYCLEWDCAMWCKCFDEKFEKDGTADHLSTYESHGCIDDGDHSCSCVENNYDVHEYNKYWLFSKHMGGLAEIKVDEAKAHFNNVALSGDSYADSRKEFWRPLELQVKVKRSDDSMSEESCPGFSLELFPDPTGAGAGYSIGYGDDDFTVAINGVPKKRDVDDDTELSFPDDVQRENITAQMNNGNWSTFRIKLGLDGITTFSVNRATWQFNEANAPISNIKHLKDHGIVRVLSHSACNYRVKGLQIRKGSRDSAVILNPWKRGSGSDLDYQNKWGDFYLTQWGDHEGWAEDSPAAVSQQATDETKFNEAFPDNDRCPVYKGELKRAKPCNPRNKHMKKTNDQIWVLNTKNVDAALNLPICADSCKNYRNCNKYDDHTWGGNDNKCHVFELPFEKTKKAAADAYTSDRKGCFDMCCWDKSTEIDTRAVLVNDIVKEIERKYVYDDILDDIKDDIISFKKRLWGGEESLSTKEMNCALHDPSSCETTDLMRHELEMIFINGEQRIEDEEKKEADLLSSNGMYDYELTWKMEKEAKRRISGMERLKRQTLHKYDHDSAEKMWQMYKKNVMKATDSAAGGSCTIGGWGRKKEKE